MPDAAVYEFDGEELYACPEKVVDDEALAALEKWTWMRRGFLSNTGGVEDQDELDLIVIDAIDAVAIKMAEE